MTISLSEQAYRSIRRMIIRLDLAPGAVIREDELREQLRTGRTPIREAIQRLVRDQFVVVLPRRGAFVTGIDVSELALLSETRRMLEPYATRLACVRGRSDDWDAMQAAIDAAASRSSDEILDADRACHEIVWSAAGNRFLTDTLDMLYAHSDRLWHMYLAEVQHPLTQNLAEHRLILDALRQGDSERSAQLVDDHIRAFDEQVREAVTRRLEAPLGSA
jgi:DNA-binding GntR family transcriptional regulator